MLRVSISFASFAAALADKCTREEYANLLDIVTASTFFDAAGSFVGAASAGAGVTAIDTAYNTANSAHITAADCWDCVTDKYEALWNSYDSGDCYTPASAACLTDKATWEIKSDYCFRKTVQPQCSFAQNAVITAGLQAAYDDASKATTTFSFQSRFSDNVDAILDNASSLSCYTCHKDYYTAMFEDANHEASSTNEEDYTACKTLLVDTEKESCSAAQIAGLDASKDLLTAVLEGQDYDVVYPRLLAAANVLYDASDARAFSCVRCQEDYFVTLFGLDGSRTDCAVDSSCEKEAKAARLACMASSLETTTTTTAAAEETTTAASGVSSVAVTAAAALVAAFATL